MISKTAICLALLFFTLISPSFVQAKINKNSKNPILLKSRDAPTENKPTQGKIKRGRYYSPNYTYSCRAIDFETGKYVVQDEIDDTCAIVVFYHPTNKSFKKAILIFKPPRWEARLNPEETLKVLLPGLGIRPLKEIDGADGIEIVHQEILEGKMVYGAVSVEKMPYLKDVDGKPLSCTRGYLIFEEKDKVVILYNQQVTPSGEKHVPLKHVISLKSDLLEFRKTFDFDPSSNENRELRADLIECKQIIKHHLNNASEESIGDDQDIIFKEYAVADFLKAGIKIDAEKIAQMDPGFDKWVLKVKTLPGKPPHSLQMRRLLQSDPDAFKILEDPSLREIENLFKHNQTAPYFYIVGARGFLLGEQITMRLISSDGKIKEITHVVRPMVIKNKEGKVIVEATLVALPPLMTYKFNISGIAPDEEYEFISQSETEIMQHTLKGPLVMAYAPAVIGVRGGVAQVKFRFKDGATYKMDLPWGLSLMEYHLGDK